MEIRLKKIDSHDSKAVDYVLIEDKKLRAFGSLHYSRAFFSQEKMTISERRPVRSIDQKTSYRIRALMISNVIIPAVPI